MSFIKKLSLNRIFSIYLGTLFLTFFMIIVHFVNLREVYLHQTLENLSIQAFSIDKVLKDSYVDKYSKTLHVNEEKDLDTYDDFLKLSPYHNDVIKEYKFFIKSPVPLPVDINLDEFSLNEDSVKSFYKLNALKSTISLYFPLLDDEYLLLKLTSSSFFKIFKGFLNQAFIYCLTTFLVWLIWLFFIKSIIKNLSLLKDMKSNFEMDLSQMKEIALTDKLTGISNRLKGDDVLDELIEMGKRFHYPFSVILIDVDFFKKVNDTYGHNVGDDVLIKLSNCVRKYTKSSDTFCRWGGEEFFIISPGADKEKAVIFAEKLRLIIFEMDFNIPQNITCSFGVAEFLHDESKERLLDRADQNLYAAKKAGRNSVISEI